MKYDQLTISKHKDSARKGRGIAAGKGKTAGRGTKGQNSRTGSSRKPGFEGGQNPLMQRLPKLHGFRSYNIKLETIDTTQLEELGKNKVDNNVLAEANLISSPFVKVKLLKRGELKTKIELHIQSASAEAVKALEAAGGSFHIEPQQKRVTKKLKKENK